MTTGFFQFFNNKAQRAQGRAKGVKRDRFPMKPRRLLTEALEERQLLAVDVMNAGSDILATETANVINITSSDYSIDAIKAAVEAAAASPEDDVIRIAAGKMQFTSANDTIEIDIDSAAYGSITIQGVGDGVAFDANELARVFTIKNGNVTIEAVTVTNGSADYGGAIANAGNLTLKNVTLSDNTASIAGGAVANKGALAVQDSVVSNNTSAGDGAAIYSGDFAWPTVVAPEWTSMIGDQVGEEGTTVKINLADYCNEGNWTYSFTCSKPDSEIFSAEPTLVDGVLTLSFLSKDDYQYGTAEADFSAVEFTVTASDGSETVTQSFNVAHKNQTSVEIAAILSNMTYDEVYDAYAQTHKQGKKVVLDGFMAEETPDSELVDLNSDDLYVQVWASDFCYEDGESQNVWICGEYIITGYEAIVELTNATLVESYSADTWARSAYGCEDLGDGRYHIAIAYSSGTPFGYNDALLVDVLKIKATDPTQPVTVKISQYSTDFTLPSMCRLYDDPVTADNRTYTKINPTQITYVSSVSNSTEPVSSLPGVSFDKNYNYTPVAATGEEEAIADYNENYVANADAYTLKISNSLIIGNTATNGSGAIYVSADDAAAITNSTIADNSVKNAAIYALAGAVVGNSIIVNDNVAPVSASTLGANNLVNAEWTGSKTYDSTQPLFVNDGSYALATNSQAINIGSQDYMLDVTGEELVVDLAGNPRVSATVDAGAYEYQGSAPNTPTGLTVSDYVESMKNPTLSWKASVAVDGVDGYYVYFGNSNEPIATVTATSLDNLANLVTLKDNSSYKFAVAAFNEYGVSGSASVNLSTLVAPDAPTNLVFSEYVDNSATLTWNVVSNAKSYRVELTNLNTGVVESYTVTDASYSFEGLSDFTNYSCSVTAINARGEATSQPATLDTTVTPEVPTGLETSLYAGDGKTSLSWNNVDNAEGYKVAVLLDGVWQVVGTTDENSYQLTDLENNSTYVLGVAAYATKNGQELVSDFTQTTFYTTVAPDAPTDLVWKVEYANNAATLAWNPSEGAVGYTVAIYQNNVWTTVGTTANSELVLSGLTDNQEYVVGVAAYSVLNGQNLYSDYAKIDLNTVVAPAAASSARFLDYAGGTSAKLTWNASVGGASGYAVQQQVDGVWTTVANVDSVGYTASVRENSSYNYRVVAYNVVGDQTRYADASNVAALDTLVPPQGDITVAVGDYDYEDGTAKITWNNLPFASYYVVSQKTSDDSEYSIVASKVVAGSDSAVSYDLNDLAQHTTYSFRVVAYNAKGEGSVGYSDEFYTAAPPTQPTVSYVYDSAAGAVTFTFAAEYATSYVLKNASGEILYNGSENSYVVTGLQENENYKFTIAATNAVGSSAETSVDVYTAAVPHAPNAVAFGEYAGNAAMLSWNDVEAETGYSVYKWQNSEWVKVQDLAADVVEFNVAGLEDYQSYTYCVTAFNEIGESAKSASATLDTTVAPNAPTGLTFTFNGNDSYQGDGKATFTWNTSEHAVGYAVYQRVDGVWTSVASTVASSYDLTGLNNYSSYEFGVAAYSLRGSEKLYSAIVDATLDTNWVPTADITLTVGEYDASAKSALLSWNAVGAATEYKIQQYVDGNWTLVATTDKLSYELSLDDNTNYAFRVVAANELGDGSSDSVEFFTAAAPASPVVKYVYDSETMSITLSFDADYATSYVVSNGDGDVLYQGSNTTYVATGLAENENYTFNVVAVNEKGASNPETISVYTAAVPAAPTNLAFGDYVEHTATLSWSPADSALGYRVYTQTADGWTQFGSDLGANENALTIFNFADYGSYTFCVVAFNAEGESAKSDSIVLDTTVAPAAPENLKFTFGESVSYQGDGVAALNWDAVEHAAGYSIQQKVDGVWTTLATTTSTSFELAGIENFNVYEYAVAAYATKGSEKLYSDYVDAKLDTAWTPTADIVLSVSDYDYNEDSSTLSWNVVEHASGYRVERLVSDAWTVVASVDSNEYKLALADNTQYTFRVVAFNEMGDGSNDSVEFFTFAPPAAPADAAFSEFVAETGKATMSWSDVAYAQWYEVRYNVNDEWVVVQRDVANYTADGLVEDSEYTYYVRACNFIGSTSVEGYSDWVEVVLDTHPSRPPYAPSELAVVEYNEATSTAKLTWNDNSKNEERFVVQRSYDGENWTNVAYLDANVTTCAISALQRGTTYQYRVCAENQFGTSDWATVEYTVPSGAPAAPSDLAFSEYNKDEHSFVMSWTDNSVNELYFKVEYSLDGQNWNGSYTVAANTTQLSVANLIEGQVYQFRVSAWNSFGISDYAYGSYEIPIDGKLRPVAPSDVVFSEYNYSANSVQMSWTDNSDNEDSFVIEFSFDGNTWRKAGSTAADVTVRSAVGMIVGRTYYFRVAASNVAGQSEWAYGEFSVDSVLPAPTNFVFGKYDNGKLETSWSYDGKLDEENGGFILQYSVDGSTWRHASYTGYNVTERVAEKVEAGGTYYFRVAAYDGANYSDWLYSDAYTAPANVPNAPVDLVVDEFANNTAKLSWNDAADLEVGFNVQYSVNNGESWISAGNNAKDVVSKNVSNLRWAGDYLFRVRAYNYYGASEWVVVSYSANRSENIPNAPTDVVIDSYDADAKTLVTSWTDNSNNEQGFTVQYSYDEGRTWYVSASCAENTTSRQTYGLVSGRTYQFRVCAYNDEGTSDWAYSEQFFAASSDQIPAAPTGLTASLDAEAKTAQLAWTDSAENEEGFKVEVCVDGAAWTECASVDADSTGCVVSGLSAGKTYAFRVVAFNSYGSSDPSNQATLVLDSEGELLAPNFENYSYSTRKRQIVLTWSEVENAASYVVQFSVDQSTWYDMAASGNSATLSSVTYGKTYYFRVKAVADELTSEWTVNSYNTVTGASELATALLEVADETEPLATAGFGVQEIDDFFENYFDDEI